MEEQDKLIVFQEKRIRHIWYNNEWWFSVIDVIAVLTDSNDPKQYWKKLNQRDPELKGGVQIVPLLLATEGGKQKVLCASTQGIFRLIQSVPSPKAEPFKQWLAQVGYERVQEIENPELAAQRARSYYKELGYSEAWIETRLKSVEIRDQLTDEWKNRGVKEGLEYAILTAEISRATFGLTPTEYKEVKGLQRENLRDHMTDIELIFTMLGEATTRNKAIDKDAKGFEENKEAAIEGGRATGKARTAYEQESGQKVVSPSNFKGRITEAKKQKSIEAKQKPK